MSDKKLFSKKVLAVAVATTATLTAGMPLAQAQSNESALEEVIVTATRRQQSVQDIPFNISAITGKTLDDANIQDSMEFLRHMPGITVPDSGARLAENNNNITIRGLNVNPGATDRAFLSDPTVSTYVDNTPVFGNFILKDINRIEVLRGPQGTLYGSGSLGGTVRYILNKPSTDQFEGQVYGSVGTTEGSDGENYSTDGILNIPLTDTMALRLLAGYVNNDGVVDYVNRYKTENGIPVAEGGDIVNGGPVYINDEDADDVEVKYGRAALLFQPSDDLEFLATYMHHDGDYGGRRQQTSGPNGWGEYYDDHEIGAVLAEPADSETDMGSLEIEYDLGFATLSSSTSYYDRSFDSVSDNTGFTAAQGWLVYYSYGLYPRPAMKASRENDQDAFVQELRLASNGENTIDWVVGAFYMDQDTKSSQLTSLPGWTEWHEAAGEPFYWLGPEAASFDWKYERAFTDIAVFGELTYHITDTVQFTLGARSFDNEDDVTSQTGFPIYAAFDWAFGPEVKDKNEEDDTLFKGNMSWRFNDDNMVYGTISEGYRRGGTNAVPVYPNPEYPNDPDWAGFDSDSVTNYELGLKGQTSRLSYTVAIFYVDWQDPQVNVDTTSGAYYAVANADEAESKGVETEFDWFATDNLRFSGGYTYVDAELTEDLVTPGLVDETELLGTDGAQMPGTPEHTVNLAGTYTYTLQSGMDFVTRVDGYYQSEVENSIQNINPDWAESMDDFQLWNLSFSLVTDAWTVSLYGKNIFDEEGSTATYKEEYMTSDPSQGFFGTGQKDFITTPRTISLSGTYRF
jgi:outer membrane receptor protein involved in Fe transport